MVLTDWVLLGALLLSVLLGLWRGLVYEVLSLAGWVVAFVLAQAFADEAGVLVDQLGVRDRATGIALRATFIVDPDNVIRHVSVNSLLVGRNPDEVLRVLDALQTDAPCACQRDLGGPTL